MELRQRLVDINPIIECLSGGEHMKSMAESIYDEIFIHLLEKAPVVDAAPVIHATWTLNNYGSGTCSNCHFTQANVWDYDHHQQYCGVCGAKMSLEEI